MVAYLDQETSGLPNGAGKIEGAVEKKPWTLKMRAEIELEIELQNSTLWFMFIFSMSRMFRSNFVAKNARFSKQIKQCRELAACCWGGFLNQRELYRFLFGLWSTMVGNSLILIFHLRKSRSRIPMTTLEVEKNWKAKYGEVLGVVGVIQGVFL